jgi:hypothetical protein
MPPLMNVLILGFIAGFLAVPIFHQSLWSLFNRLGFIPPDRPAWPMGPIPPFGVPSVISKSFWGGLWGAGLALLLGQLSGSTYWTAWVLVGAVALTSVAFFVVAPLKGEPIPALWTRFVTGLCFNGAWGFGTALLLRLLALLHW